MEYLFLCAYGWDRSPTAAFVALEIARRSGLEIRMSYGGIKYFLDELKTSPVGSLRERLRTHLNDFDRIFVMEDYMAEGIIGVGVSRDKIHCLHIPNEYVRNEPVLKKLLEEKLKDLI